MVNYNDDSAGLVDPPQQPLAGTERWFATGPAALQQNERLAVLMVRVGMAANALTAQVGAMHQAQSLRGAVRMQYSLSSLVTSAAITYESMRLAREGMRDLRALAEKAGAPAQLLKEIVKLCGGKHPANSLLERARNNLGFHWDADVIVESVREYARNAALIWIETDAEGLAVHRLAADVLAHALIPESGRESNSLRSIETGTAALMQISDAMDTIIEFFTAATYGYLQFVGGKRYPPATVQESPD